MTATEGNLLQFLGPMAQFSIPVYQRTYTWTRASCPTAARAASTGARTWDRLFVESRRR